MQILNESIQITDQQSWNDPTRDKLLLYHLHYMDDLTALDADKRAYWHRDLIDQWMAQNPPVLGNGWEPYPLSLRIVNWTKWALAGNELSERQLQSLWIQARVLRQSVEYHLQANHLLANAKALFFAGAYFEGAEPDRWLSMATRLLSRQIAEQVLEDGGHFERSPMYQSVILEDFLDVVNIGRAYGLSLPRIVKDVIPKMMRWLATMTHPDGEPAYFNDTVAAHAVPLEVLRRYAQRLGFSGGEPHNDGLTALRDSGFFIYRDADLHVFGDVGEIGSDFQPGHAHCECLSFEMSIGTRRVFVNTGISTYNANSRRHTERSTAAHNTVSVDGLEQNEIWGAFRVGRRARSLDVKVGDHYLSAGHDGYGGRGIIHRRRIDFLPKRIEIADTLDAATPPSGTAHFHCHPDLNPVPDNDGVSIDGVRLTFENADDIRLGSYEFCEGFNRRRRATEIRVSFESTLTTTICYEDTFHIG